MGDGLNGINISFQTLVYTGIAIFDCSQGGDDYF
jgi:hypothetical protein